MDHGGGGGGVFVVAACTYRNYKFLYIQYTHLSMHGTFVFGNFSNWNYYMNVHVHVSKKFNLF